MHRTRILSMDIAGAEATNVEAIIMDCSTISQYAGCEVDGYVGTSYLKDFAMTLDYGRGLVTLTRWDSR